MRQLENTSLRAVVLCDGSVLDVCDFPQIAAAMGMDGGPRANHAVSRPVSAETPAASPYAPPLMGEAG